MQNVHKATYESTITYYDYYQETNRITRSIETILYKTDVIIMCYKAEFSYMFTCKRIYIFIKRFHM